MPVFIPSAPKILLFSMLVNGMGELAAHSLSDLEVNPKLKPDRHAATESLALQLAQNYTDQLAFYNLLISEKLDGVRAYWDGLNLRFKSGRVIRAPKWFYKDFPQQAMDGELWMGRQSFERLSSAVRRQQPDDAEWRQIQYRIFDAPQDIGSFSQRFQAVEKRCSELHIPWLGTVPQLTVKTDQELRKLLQEISNNGGEGLILHKADAQWMAGRSNHLFKLKTQLDAEAQVIAYEAGKGKYLGQLGALVVMTANGKRFKLGTGLRDEDRRNPPSIGSFVTYRYRDLTPSGVPKFASFLRVRPLE